MADGGKEEGTVWKNIILGDPGEVIVGGKSQNGIEKIIAKKSQGQEEEPLGTRFNGPVPNGRSSSSLSLVPENPFFFCPITKQQD